MWMSVHADWHGILHPGSQASRAYFRVYTVHLALMDIDYQVRHRNAGALFKIASPKLQRRIQYLDQRTDLEVSARERADTRPGVEETEVIYTMSDVGGSGEQLIAVERYDEARIRGDASLMSEPATMVVPRSAEAVIAFAEKCKNGGNYDAANAAFALAIHEHFPTIECSLSVRERYKTPKGDMTDGYYDLAYVGAGEEETCIPIPKLRGDIAYWFAAHAERRAPIPHNRDSSGTGPTIGDLEAMLGRETVREAVLKILSPETLDDRYTG